MSSKAPSGFQSLKEFLKSIQAEEPRQMLRAMPGAAAGQDTLAEMRSHVLQHYEGVEAETSFMDENGSIFDCVPVEQQPSLRRLGEAPARPPELPTAPQEGRGRDRRRAELVPPLQAERQDRHGNRMLAPTGTIPLRRLELKTLARFGSLQEFLQKSPYGSAVPQMAGGAPAPGGPRPVESADPSGGGGAQPAPQGAILRGADLRGADLRDADLSGVDLSEADLRGADLRGAIFSRTGAVRQRAPALAPVPPRAALASPRTGTDAIPPAVEATHRWAHASQGVANIGGHSCINLWDPPIGANQIFSLAQHWYVNGSGAGLQTAEVGWQVYPQKYNDTRPVLFIYFTSGNYAPGTGCYNLDDTGFVQTGNAWAIGGALTGWSTRGGTQRELEVAFYLADGRWWLYVGGETPDNALGYYPASVYRGGAMTNGASSIDYGGETVGTTSFPPMGSGAFANAGWQQAAYHRDIRYYVDSGTSQHASLTPIAASPGCYTAQVTQYGAPWNQTLFFGGPGGTSC